MSGHDEEETAREVEELTRRRVLQAVGDRLDFTHDRVREVAYGRILPPRRKALHRRVAEGLATLYAEDLDPHQLALGLHYAEGEAWDKAVVHLRRAGMIAMGRSANQEAIACFERALAALAHLPDSRDVQQQAFEIRLELRHMLVQLGKVRQGLHHLHEAESLAEQLNDDGRRGRVCVFLTNMHSVLGELDEAIITGARAIEIAERLGDLPLRIVTMTYLEQAHCFRGDHERVIELATDNLATLPANSHREHFGASMPVSVYARLFLVWSLAERGRFTEAADHAAQTLRLAEATQHPYSISEAHFTAGRLHCFKGDWAEARSQVEEGIAVVRATNIVLSLPGAVGVSAWILAQLGETSEALARLREGEDLLERDRVKEIVGYRAYGYYLLARASVLLGRLDQARRLGHRAVELLPSRPGLAPHALHLLGDIATHPDGFDAEQGEAHYRRALAERHGMRPLVAHCYLGLGTLRRRIGDRHGAGEHLETAAALYQQMDMRFWLGQAEAAMTARATTVRADEA